ncbi:hypothetical protein G6011_04158 [Alternaria panax]|uniref:C2H2-type domain-containing protein n=1 Tax=Alternaria panax TaxID=48097 RepID=A0AAD4NTR2_9PLEO|nr:hypothetical protein G6011_04158 [Alternaria panax]
MSFDTEKIMKNHKKNFDDHEYCHKCDEDFETFEDYAMHKIIRPEEHNKACRVCGDEFKSTSGLKRHIELNHKVDQKLTCIGCQKSFYRACLFIEHLEFGHCGVISASQFQGHIVHKHLITEYLQNGQARDRLNQKTSKYEAAIDLEEDGGVQLSNDPIDDEADIEKVEFTAIKPDVPTGEPTPVFGGRYPLLPTQTGFVPDVDVEIASMMGGMSLNGDADVDSDGSTVIESPCAIAFPAIPPSPSRPESVQSQYGSSIHGGSETHGSSVSSSNRETKVWGPRKGKSTGSILFPNTKPKALPSDFSISAHDEAMEKEHGPNLLRDRFWDPMSADWNPEKFYDSIVNKYYCPFVCEQNFDIRQDLNTHILADHRITRMKCPKCLKYFNSATALMAHCESRGARCSISHADDFALFLDKMSGGFLGVQEKVRPDHLNTRPTMLRNAETGHMEMYKPPVASYLQYTVTTPPDWKDPVRSTVQIGGMPGKSQW